MSVNNVAARQLPASFGPLKGANGNARITGPCGDTMEFWIRCEEGTVRECTFTTDGCGDSILCGAAAAKMAGGAPEEVVYGLQPADILSILSGFPEESVHCAKLAVDTLRGAISMYRKNSCSGESCSSCAKSDCDAAVRPAPSADQRSAAETLQGIKHRIVVLSGKGGVGKSTVAVNLAAALAREGMRVGLLDVDIHGPSVPVLLGLQGQRIQSIGDRMLPVETGGILVMSVGLLIEDQDDAVIWRGPMKAGVIQQFVHQVEWGELDYLIVDCPPGTGDEPLSVCQTLGEGTQALVVTTPQDVAAADVRKSITFCRKINLPVLGLVENMSGFVCPSCGEMTPIFKTGGGKALAERFGIPFLGALPLDPEVGEAGDAGKPFIRLNDDAVSVAAFIPVADRVLELECGMEENADSYKNDKEIIVMKIAVPVADGKLNMHFGHCAGFDVFETEEGKITAKSYLEAPPHEPGLLPRFLGENGVGHIIAGGMGQRAQSLFAENGITVTVGAPAGTSEDLVKAHLLGTLKSGTNVCDH